MPYKRRAKIMRRKPRRIPRRRVNKLRNRVPNGAAPVARKHVVKLKYTEVLDWGPLTLQTISQQYRLNSVFDPNLTGVGHQPYGFDQLAALFQHYRVFKCSWHIQFAPSNDRLHVAVGAVNGNATFSSIESFGEFPGTVTKAMAFAGGVPCNFKGTCWLPKLTGASSTQYKTDDRYSSAVTASPVEVMLLNILMYNPTAATVKTSMTITLTYHTEFYDPLVLPAS